MKDILNGLIKLQDIDSRLLEIDELRGDLPFKVEKQGLEVSAYKAENEKKTNRIKEIEQECRKRSVEIEDFSTKLNKYREKLYLVTSNKEYDALNSEIDHMKKTISDSETFLLQLEEEKLEIEELLTSNSNKIEEVELDLERNQEELERALESTRVEEKKLFKNRKELTGKISPQYLQAYDRLRSVHDGLGLVSITRKACGSCYSQLPQQTLIEVKQNDQIINCVTCGAFLYWDGAED